MTRYRSAYQIIADYNEISSWPDNDLCPCGNGQRRVKLPADAAFVAGCPSCTACELLEDVVRSHADKQSPDFNGCGGLTSTDRDCIWCEHAKAAIAGLRRAETPALEQAASQRDDLTVTPKE